MTGGEGHAVELDSVGTGGTPAGSGDGSFLVGLSGGGRYIVFETKAPFDAAHDTNGVYDIYLHDRVTNTTRLISHAPDGTAGNAQSFEGNGGPVISQDGSTVAFASDASNLVPGDGNNRMDIFVWHAASDTLERASPNASGTASAAASYSRHERPPNTRRNRPTSWARGVCRAAYVANGTSRRSRRLRTRGTVIGSF